MILTGPYDAPAEDRPSRCELAAEALADGDLTEPQALIYARAGRLHGRSHA